MQTVKLIDFLQVCQFELFCVAVTCFWYGGFLGYDHIIWKPVRERGLKNDRRL